MAGGADAALVGVWDGLAGGGVGEGEAVAVQAPTTRISPAAMTAARTSVRGIGTPPLMCRLAPLQLRASLAVLRGP
jgi:hypothetical protein